MAKQVSFVVSHWGHLFEGLQETPQSFYKDLEDAIGKRGLPEVSVSRIDYHEGGAFSAKREYFRVERQRLVFDVGVAPMGDACFVSWWMGEVRSFWSILVSAGIVLLSLFLYTYFIAKIGLFVGTVTATIVLFGFLALFGYLIREGTLRIELSLSEVPLFGRLFDLIFNPDTYYRTDTMLGFQEAVSHSVMDVIDRLTEQKGLHKLTESERKPIMRDLFKK